MCKLVIRAEEGRGLIFTEEIMSASRLKSNYQSDLTRATLTGADWPCPYYSSPG